MYTLQFETKTNPHRNFISATEFANSIIAIPKVFYDYNIMVKGSTRTGKTQKIMLPMFSNLNKKNISKIYFSAKSLNLLDLSDIQSNYFEIEENNFENTKEEIYKSVRDGKNTIVCFGGLLGKPTLITKYFTELMKSISEKKQSYFFIDDFQHFPRNTFILENINKDNIKFYMALEYSNQLLNMGYSEEEKCYIKSNSKSIDTEKQFL